MIPAQPAVRVRTAELSDMPEIVAIDDDATQLYARSGLALGLSSRDPFVIAEQARWERSLRAGRALLAVEERGRALGVAILDVLDGEPYLDQLSVRADAMGRGVGTQLLETAIAWASRQRGRGLWLTTYDHLWHNRPFYERRGFSVVPEGDCPPGVRHHLEEQRAALPAPDKRVAMLRPSAIA